MSLKRLGAKDQAKSYVKSFVVVMVKVKVISCLGCSGQQSDVWDAELILETEEGRLNI